LAAVSSKEESELKSAPTVTFPSQEVENQISTVKVSKGTPLQGSRMSLVIPNQKTTGDDLVDNMVEY
jgi:hypothetical protein